MATLYIARDKKKCLLCYASHKARYHIFTSTYTCVMCRFLSDRFESCSKTYQVVEMKDNKTQKKLINDQ